MPSGFAGGHYLFISLLKRPLGILGVVSIDAHLK